MANADMYTDYSFTCILNPLLTIEGLAMAKARDITGCVFGKLTVLEFVKSEKAKRMWRCMCECGKTIEVPTGSLVTGNTKSCGCYHMERITKHGGWQKGSYNTWRAMMRRCYNPKDKDFAKYGAVGVVVQESWHEYIAFAADVGEPEGTQTLHRIDPYGDYTKENCMWASPIVQARVTRLHKNNKTGHVGVALRNGKYMAEITVQRKKYYGKCRAVLEEAIADRKELERLYWGEVT